MLTVRRSFRLKNTGSTPLWVQGFEVEGQSCEGYGFRVLNCDESPGGFALGPEEARDVDIAFTPDFTLSLITRSLALRTSLGGGFFDAVSEDPSGRLNFTLEATVPPALVAQCSAALPRPDWELYLYYGLNGFMFVFALAIMVAAFLESDRIVKVMMMIPLLQQQQQHQRQQQRERSENGHAGRGSYEDAHQIARPFDLRGIQQQVRR